MTGHRADVLPPNVTSAAGRASAGGATVAVAMTAAMTLRRMLPIVCTPFGSLDAERVRRAGHTGQHPLVSVLTPRWGERHVGDL